VAEEPIDLIRFAGKDTSVVLRITGAEGGALVGEFVVDTPFVRGSRRASVRAADLWEWRDALDGLDAGHDVAWREETLVVERDEERVHVTVRDSEAAATVTVPLTDSWFDDAYERLDLVLKTWPL
jgi:hypothetical protein